jgi:1-aminocyclopropane-1-carboxylate deaminase
MKFQFISREAYRNKENQNFLDSLYKKHGRCYVLPEGGTNTLAVKGCEEILSDNTRQFNNICVPVGTGGTISGLIQASENTQQIVGFSALKGTFQTSEIKKFTSKSNYFITDAYCFGGYAKIDSELIRFINEFKVKTAIPLDPIYTGKMMFGIFELLKNGHFKENSRILAVHTGGLQGIAGTNLKLKKKNLPLIE